MLVAGGLFPGLCLFETTSECLESTTTSHQVIQHASLTPCMLGMLQFYCLLCPKGEVLMLPLVWQSWR